MIRQALLDSPLRRKLTLILMMTALTTLVIVLVALAITESRQFRRSFQRELKSIAAVTGGNSVAALEFLDTESAERTLSVLSNDPRIWAASLYDASGRAFASYRSKHGEVILPPDLSLPLPSHGIHVEEPVIHNNRRTGTVVIVASDREVIDRLAEFGTVALLVALFSALAAYLLSRRLQDIISSPIIRLGKTALEVSESKNYSLRAQDEGLDEIGQLVRQFNDMLGTVERTAAELQANEKQLRTITDALPVLIAYIDSDYRYQFNNAAYQALYDTSPSEMKGRRIEEFLGEETFRRDLPHFQRVMAGEPQSYERTIDFPERGERVISSSFVPDITSAGVIGFFALGMDITDAKTAERERDLLLASERSARSEAERASQLKDEFLATLSHELRTPLNAIIGWCQLLKRPNNSVERVSEGMAVISRSANMQAQLISDLLDLSGIISGKLSVESNVVAIKEVLRAAHDSVGMSASAKNIKINYVVPQGNPLVRGDAARLQQVFWNLLTNAIKFTPNAGSIQVELSKVDANWCEIGVSDTGQGIPSHFLPHVFERFRQADASSTRKYGGLGIGLSLVKQLVELHGGIVEVESAGQDQGATFKVRLPLLTDVIGSSPNDDVVAPPHLGHLTVLIVDDEADALGVLKTLLEDISMTVLTANSALSALEVFKANTPDIILSDIGMPVHSGYDFLKFVQEHEQGQDFKTPAIALTAFAREEDRVQALNAGFNEHIAKPVNYNNLVSAIVRLVELNPRPPAR